MKVSVITPFYHGNCYMERYVKCLLMNQKNLPKTEAWEILMVNDSPDDMVNLPPEAKNLPLRVIERKTNGGIHAARIQGLSEATGDYILFLDQDDVLAADAIAREIRYIESFASAPDVIVCNAMLEQKDGSALLWYRSSFQKKRIGDYQTYLRVGIQIISPGQCLIRREIIPEFWMNKICSVNGADDYFLWLLLLAGNTKFHLLDEPLYIHTYTGSNVSSDTAQTDASVFSFLPYLREYPKTAEKDVVTLEKMLRYKAAFRQGDLRCKAKETLRHPGLFLTNLIFKLRSRTPYGFNR